MVSFYQKVLECRKFFFAFNMWKTELKVIKAIFWFIIIISDLLMWAIMCSNKRVRHYNNESKNCFYNFQLGFLHIESKKKFSGPFEHFLVKRHQQLIVIFTWSWKFRQINLWTIRSQDKWRELPTGLLGLVEGHGFTNFWI